MSSAFDIGTVCVVGEGADFGAAGVEAVGGGDGAEVAGGGAEGESDVSAALLMLAS